MNIAQRFIDYYSSEDFINSYAEFLFEDTSDVIDRIIEACNDYCTIKYYSPEIAQSHAWHMQIEITKEQAQQIKDYILENIEDFTTTFSNYYVGSTCLSSISFEEQSEQLTGIYNHQTGKDYNIKYLKRVFSEECFHISGDCAYYGLSGEGVMIDLLASEIPLLRKIFKNAEDEL